MSALDDIQELERTFLVESWTIGGLRVWPIARIALTTAWVSPKWSGPDTHGVPAPGRVAALQLWRALRIHAKWGASVRHRVKSDVLVLSYDTDRVPSDHGFYNIYSDTWRDILAPNGYGVQSVERPVVGYRLPTYREFLDFLPYCVWPTVGARLQGPFGVPPAVEADLVASAKWCARRGLSAKGLDPQWLARSARYICALSTRAESIIRQIKPKLVMVVCWYGHVGMAWVLACRRVGIPCFDLQHGSGGAHAHRAYAGWSAVPPEGFELTPDGYWVWDNADAAAILDWGSRLHTVPRVFVGGDPWAALWSGGPPRAFASTANRAIEPLKKLPRPRILLSLQGQRELPKLVTTAITNGPREWHWLIRCHPTQLSALNDFAPLTRQYPNVEVEASSRAPLFAVLPEVDVHITGWSSVVVDASRFGVPSVTIDPMARSYYGAQHAAGEVLHAESIDALIDAIRTALQRRVSRTPTLDSLHNGLHELFKLLRE